MHFYTEKDGVVQPRHFVAMAKDPTRQRASRVTDAKKALKDGEVWMPSVTTVLNVLDKPGLNVWKVDQALQAAYDCPIVGEYDEWKSGVMSLMNERMDAAPQAGTDFHALMEDHMNGKEVPKEWREYCGNVSVMLLAKCGRQNWETEKYFISKDGYAGCADLVSDEWVIDYKTKQFSKQWKPGKMAFVDHARQLAAYDWGMPVIGERESRRCANIFICLETGEVDFYEHDDDALDSAFDDFMAALGIYHRNVYNPFGE